MKIKDNDRYKLEKILKSIQDVLFNEITIDGLLIGLRPYSTNHPAFRDIADMVAHPEQRNKGPANVCINTFFHHIRFLKEYVFINRPLDLLDFPIYVKKILIRKIETTPDAEIEKRYKEPKRKIIHRLNSLFIEDKKTGTAKRKGKLTAPTFEIIQNTLGTLSAMPAYDQHDVINGLLQILEEQGLGEYVSAVEVQSCKITACILALFHKRTHRLEDLEQDSEATCEISHENGGYAIGINYVDEYDQPVEVVNSLGNLTVNCSAPMKQTNGNMGIISFSIFKTELLAEEWCEESLACIRPPLSGPADILYFSMDFKRAVGISKNFKLTAI